MPDTIAEHRDRWDVHLCSKKPTGLGEPCFDKLEAKLAHAMLSIPATKGFEIESGFEILGTLHNDAFIQSPAVPFLRTRAISTAANRPRPTTKINTSGGNIMRRSKEETWPLRGPARCGCINGAGGKAICKGYCRHRQRLWKMRRQNS